MGISIKVGQKVEGDDFYGREKELEYAWHLIEKGNSLILSAPRRVGKSSFSLKMKEKARSKNWKTLFIDLEEVKTERAFVKLFLDKLQEEDWWEKSKSKLGDTFSKLLESVKDIEIAGTKVSIDMNIWRSDAYSRLQKLIEDADEMLIVIDELTIFLNSLLENENGKQDVEFFLNWLRSLRQNNSNVRWIFCSSTGIDNFTSLHNLSYTLNDVHSFPIDEFTKTEAQDFIQLLALSEGITISKELTDYILYKLGWRLPYFIQILFEKINYLCEVKEEEFSKTTIDKAYQELITQKHFNSWDERLKEYLDKEIHARTILETLSGQHEGRTREKLFDVLYVRINEADKTTEILVKLLSMLQNDGYIMCSADGKYLFRSPLLRDFWYNRFVR